MTRLSLKVSDEPSGTPAVTPQRTAKPYPIVHFGAKPNDAGAFTLRATQKRTAADPQSARISAQKAANGRKDGASSLE